MTIAQRSRCGSSVHRARTWFLKPTCSACNSTRVPGWSTSAAFRCPFAEQALGTEDEDQDQDREHDRLGPVGARSLPAEALVEGLDEPDQQGAEDGAGQVADPAE